MAGFAKTEFLPARVAVLTGLAVLAYVVTVYLIFFLTYMQLNIDHAGGVQGRYFVIALPMAAIFIASMANNDLPRDVVAATAMTGSLLSGLGREAPGATSSPAKPLGLEVPMRRQDGRSVSKLTNQTSFGAQHLPRNVAGRYCLRRSPPAWRIVEDR
jgi:hypothetical protein